MKKLILIFFTCILCVSNIHAQNILPTPGSEEWKKLSKKDRIAACQIDETILKDISTLELVERCLNYRFIKDIIFYEKLQNGFNNVKQNFNGLIELFKRKDAGIYILKKYKEMNAENIYDLPVLDKAKTKFRIALLEIFLCQQEIIHQLNRNKSELIREILNKINQMLKYNEQNVNKNYNYSRLHFDILFTSIIKIIDQTEYKNEIKHLFSNQDYKTLINELDINIIKKTDIDRLYMLITQNY